MFKMGKQEECSILDVKNTFTPSEGTMTAVPDMQTTG
jgi:hypothetical protein